ncbi:MAG: SRPBCC family protein [Gammaproteobacteria bacterium]
MPQCSQSIFIKAPVDRVWAVIRDFHDMSWAAGVIDRCEAVGEKPGTEVGARRILNGAFEETLLECDETGHRIRYSIDDGPSPVSADEVRDYVGCIQLKPVTPDVTCVEWRSDWESKSDEARDFCQRIYLDLLRALEEWVKDR